MSAATSTVLERFWAKVDVGEPDDCWVWTGGHTHGKWAYGVFHPRHGQTVRAHRLSLEMHLGRPLLPKRFACHTCDNPPCVNPAHLYEGTQLTNTRDAISRGRHKRGASDPGARLNDSSVLAIRVRAADGETNRALSAEYGVSEGLISDVTSGIRWRHVGGPLSTKYKRSEKK